MPTSYKPKPKALGHADTNFSPGIGVLVNYCLADDLTAEPLANEVSDTSTLADNIGATGTFTFAVGRGFSSIRCKENPEINVKTAPNGAYNTEFDLVFMNSEDAKGFRHTFKTSQLIFVTTDANGKKERIGTRQFPAMMESSESKYKEGSLTVKFMVPAVGVNTLPDAVVLAAQT